MILLDTTNMNVNIPILDNLAPDLLKAGSYLLQVSLIILIGVWLAKMVRRILSKALNRTELDVGISRFLVSLINTILYMLIAMMAAERIGIPSTSILAVIGSAGLAIGLALQGSLSNFAGSVLILIMRPFTVGDYIVFSDGEGVVKNIGLVYTTLATGDNRRINVPNGILSNTTVTNVTSQAKRRMEVTVGIGYQSDLKKAKEILEEILLSDPMVLKEESIQVFVSELTDRAVMIGGRAWTASENAWSAKCAVTEQIKLRFDELGVEIAIPQTRIHIDRK